MHKQKHKCKTRQFSERRKNDIVLKSKKPSRKNENSSNTRQDTFDIGNHYNTVCQRKY